MLKAINIESPIKQWMSNYPEEHRRRLRGRLESKRASDYLGALYELTIHEFLLTLGWNPEVDPSTDFGTPDFRATTTNGASFYCEASVIDPSVLHIKGREQRVCDELGRLTSPNYTLMIKVKGELLSNPPIRAMKSHFQRWIDAFLVPDDDSLVKPTSPSFCHEGWKITLTAFSRIPEGSHIDTPTLGPVIRYGLNAADRLVDKVKDKNATYSGIGGPLIVAVHDVRGVVDPKLDVPVALFGWERSTCDEDRVDIRRPTGVSKLKCLWGAH